MLLRALEPAARVTFRVTGGPAGDVVTLRTPGGTTSVTVGAGETRAADLAPGAAFAYKETAVYVLRLISTRGAPDPRDPGRSLGAFVEITLVPTRRRAP